ncbi:MAG: uracil-DNA glycosylase [Candidatus Cloacimonetes bacterium]|nr:uracil-DNA glycosylase [Candidatus Cloacimonadota bacterium]MCF7813891.1 uracil-DNA glycosylase [Candidatus Cloacimonadota bacterium]MCF7868898.1 uracil-DNA glycosylase [Candidatus Cloacimonadota bacterium]MCF7884003.1 uracil-DNA glycosylase [Candidatus Cloacimonadota bacterium]
MRDTQCKWYQTCPMKYFIEQGKLDKKWMEKYCWGDWQNCIRFQLEEKGIFHSDNMLPDGMINNSLI